MLRGGSSSRSTKEKKCAAEASQRVIFRCLVESESCDALSKAPQSILQLMSLPVFVCVCCVDEAKVYKYKCECVYFSAYIILKVSH